MSQTTYEKTTWEAGSTALSAENFNHLEKGVEDAHEMLANIFNAIYPVGSIYMSADLDTPTKVMEKFGGTWVAWGQGKVPVGVDTSDSDFSTSEKSDGAKSHSYTPAGTNSGGSVGNHTLTTSEIPSHNHPDGYTTNKIGANATGTTTAYYQLASNSTSNPVIPTARNTSNTGGGGAHNHPFTQPTFTGTAATMSHLQPYITCYMYKRTE